MRMRRSRSSWRVSRAAEPTATASCRWRRRYGGAAEDHDTDEARIEPVFTELIAAHTGARHEIVE